MRNISGSSQSNNGDDGAHTTSNKERLTVDWFSKVITEFRAELSDLQEAQNNTTRRMQQRSNCAEDLMELRDDFDKLKLEWSAMRLRVRVRLGEFHSKCLEYWHKEIVCNSFYGVRPFRQSRAASHSAGITGHRTEHMRRVQATSHLLWY